MEWDIEIISVDVPKATYERRMAKLIEALLAIDEKLTNSETAADLTHREAA